MSYASIRSAVEAKLLAVPSIGTVFDHSLVTESASLFDTVDNIWTMSLAQRRVREKSDEVDEVRYQVNILGFRPAGAGNTTELTFIDLALEIQNSLSADLSLSGIGLQFEKTFLDHEDPERDDQGVDLRISQTTFDSIPCFKAEIVLKVVAHENRTFNDQLDSLVTSQITWADTIEDTITHEQ